MRRMREKSNIVTPELPEVTKCYTEIEIRDKRQEIEQFSSGDDFSKIVQVFQNNGFGLINQGTKDTLIELTDTYSNSWVLESMDIAVTNNKRNLGYVNGILKKWQSEGKNTDKPMKDPYAGIEMY